MVKKGFFKYIGIIPVFTIISIASFATFYHFKNINSNNILSLRKITNGMHICFSRVHQTYTSSIIKSVNSPYLENRFHVNTEECFGEVITTLQNEIGATFGLISKRLNTLSKEVHWFHKKIDYKDGKLTKGNGFALDRRFSTIEEAFDSVSERISRRINEQQSKANENNLYMFIAIGLSVFFLMLNVFLQYRLNKRKEEIDLIAQEELAKDHISPKKAFFLFRKLSSAFSSERCEKLAEKLNIQSTIKYDNTVEDFSTLETPNSSKSALLPVEPIVFNLESEENIESEDHAAKEQIATLGPNDLAEEKIDSVWEKFDNEKSESRNETFSDIENKKDTSVNLGVILADAVKTFAGDFFRHGIEVEFLVEKSHEIKADKEVVSQVIYNILGSALNLNHDVTKVFIETRKDGNQEILEIRDNSKIGFDEDFILNQDNTAYSHKTKHVGLILCKELVKDINAGIEFENLYSLSKDNVGTLRTVTFTSIEKKKRLTYVRKATKSELLKSFNA